MVTYRQIQKWVGEKYGWQAKPCWIAHCKELNGLPLRRAHNREGANRTIPCPPNKQPVIEAAFRHFGMIGQA